MNRMVLMLAFAGSLGGCGTGQPATDEVTAARPIGSASPDAPSGRTKRERRASLYLRADADGDGVVTRAEIEREAVARFERLDRNGDGTVTAEEYASGSGAGRRREPDRPRASFSRERYVGYALARFDRRDRDDDGRLSGAELARPTRGDAAAGGGSATGR